MVMVMAKDMVGMEKGMVGMAKGMAVAVATKKGTVAAAMEREKDMGMGNQVMMLMTWKATMMGIRIRDPNYV